MKINYNDLSRYLIDKKIEIPLFNYLQECTQDSWEYYREIITDNWLNPENNLEGISVSTIQIKISKNAKSLNNKDIKDKDLERVKKRFKCGNNLKNGVYSFSDLKVFLNFSDPIDILFCIIKNDLKKSIRINKPQQVKGAISYLNTKRIDQYHPESSDIFHQVPFDESDVRNILTNGSLLFKNLGLNALSSSLDYYCSDLAELISEWQISDENRQGKKIYHNLPKREHAEWGFEGYEEQRKELVEKLAKGNRRLFQINGQGGSGKSALTNEVCHDLMLKHNNELRINQFIWISSKSDILDNASIKEINSNTEYKNYKDLLSQLFLAINNENISDFEQFLNFGHIELERNIIPAINGSDRIKRIIIIDNLENITHDNQKKIITFLENNVDRPNYVIITSRHRIIEDFPSINIELGGLSEFNATNLFYKLIEYYQFDFKRKSKQDHERVKNYVQIANYYPLAIKYCIEKAKKEQISLTTSFETCKNGGSDLHSFIFRDTYSILTSGQRRLLRTIVIYKTHIHEDIDKHVLKVIYNSIYSKGDFENSLSVLHQKSLISYIGLSNDNVDVILTDLITSHVEDIFKKHDIDASKIISAIDNYVKTQNELSDLNGLSHNLRTSNIQESFFRRAISNIDNSLVIDSTISDISKYSSTFYGLGYLKAKSLLNNLKISPDIRKQINDYFETSIRLKPQFTLFWVDYLSFLKKHYPATVKNKLHSKLPEIYRVFFNLNQNENKIKFAQIILDVLSITKIRDEHSIKFMEFVIQNNIDLIFEKSNLSTIKYITTEWSKKPNKLKYIDQLLKSETRNKKGEDLKTLIIKQDYPHFTVITKSMELAK